MTMIITLKNQRLWPETMEQKIEKMNATILAANNDAKEIQK